jgi:hypothetical protein
MQEALRSEREMKQFRNPQSKTIIFILIVIVAAIVALGAGLYARNLDLQKEAQAERIEYENKILERTYDKCEAKTESTAALHETLKLQDNKQTLTLYSPTTAVNTYETYSCVADQTKMPESVQEKISQTNAYSGTQNDSWDNLKATWSYDGTSGLNLIVEISK